MITIKKADPLFSEIVECAPVELSDEVYRMRVDLLRERLEKKGMTHAVIYGDREHFSHIEYFTKYDCRFEEALFILEANGKCHIIIGNEGWGFSQIVPFPVERHLYQNFSLQGQPRAASKPLGEIFAQCGIGPDSTVGLCGTKYFESAYVDTDPSVTFDVPAYLLDILRGAAGTVTNFTRELTGLPDGIRMHLYRAEEIAWAEAAANRTAAVVQRMFRQVKPGMAEYKLPSLCGVGFDAHSMHPICNFGDRSVALGMATPGTRCLKEGDPCGFCYGVRGHLTSRVGIAARDLDSVREDLRPYVESFYKKHFEAMTAWYETLSSGVTGDELYHSVMNVIGAPEFGVTLNPGHFIGTEEWSNAISADGNQDKVPANCMMQADIIASGSNPVRTSICEDGVVVADCDMRDQLRQQYPEVYARMQRRRQVMADCLGIHLHEDVLPLSNLNAVYYPFMLNTGLVFAKVDE